MFGGDGRVTTPVGEFAAANAVVVQDDGKILAAGHTNPQVGTLDADFTVVRYNADGSLDTTFGGDGIVTTSFSGPAYATDLAVQPDGKVVAGGASDVGEGASNSQVTLVRYGTDGALDASFGDRGVAQTDTGAFEAFTAVALQSDGSIVGSGLVSPDGTQTRILLVRYTAAGVLDTTFGGNGTVTTAAAPQSEATSMTVDSSDRLVVAGQALDDNNGSGQSWIVARYLPDGDLDTAFDGDGVVRTPIGSTASAVTQQGSDIVVAGCDCPCAASGRGGAESHSSFVVARFRS